MTSNLIWLFFVLAMLQPILSRKLMDGARMRLIVNLERQRGSRVIVLAHRQETARAFFIDSTEIR